MNQGLFRFPKRSKTPGMVLLGRRKFNNDGLLSFTKEFSPDIDHYRLITNSLVQSAPSDGTHRLFGRFSTNYGASFDTGAFSYQCAGYSFRDNGSLFLLGFSPTSSFFAGVADNDAGHSCSGIFDIFTGGDNVYTNLTAYILGRDENSTANQCQAWMMSAAFLSTKRISGVQIGMSNGVIVSGEMGLYGFYKG